MNYRKLVPGMLLIALLMPSSLGRSALPYCLEGVASRAAVRALESGDPAGVLIWAGREREQEIRLALEKARRVRELSADAREVADGFFIQTLNCYFLLSTGRKPQPRERLELGPAVPSAERAIESGSPEVLHILLMDMLRQEIQSRYQEVLRLRVYDPKDVEAGRRYVQRYAAFIQYIDGVYAALRGDR